ncbi:MAG: peptidoglycan editing factor PgeF, partial [Candidatus Gastranaerophilales bacterium]|nr:peptidoglycan editing factor PgeF [Candidatus Gastranaerophilales bacterium]
EHFFTTRETVLRSSEKGVDTSSNIKSVCEYLNIETKNLISPTQVHSSNVDFAQPCKINYPETDALILTNYEQAVYLNFADCTPVVLYDKKSNVAAAVHAGWRGTAGRIAVKTVNKMLEYSDSSITDIYAVIGAAIGDCCYEVGDDVVKQIQNSVNNYSDLTVYRNNRPYVNLKKTNARQLEELGVPVDNIDICPYCTYCRSDLFFSYRRENGTTSRHSAVIKLNVSRS